MGRRFVFVRATGVLFVAVSIAFLVVSCSDDETPVTPTPQAGSVTLHFDQQVSGVALTEADLDPADYKYVNAGTNAYSIAKLKYIVSDMQLHTVGGKTFGVDDYHIRDAADDTNTRSYTIDAVPNGAYNAVSFTFGLDESKNVSGPPISDDPHALDMGWPPNWGGGWHYMILEGFFDPANDFPYLAHTGRRFIEVAGPNDPPDAPDTTPHNHNFRVVLPLAQAFQVDGNAWELRVIMDINGWYDDPLFDLSVYFPGGIMVNLGAQALLQANGPGCFTVTPAVPSP